MAQEGTTRDFQQGARQKFAQDPLGATAEAMGDIFRGLQKLTDAASLPRRKGSCVDERTGYRLSWHTQGAFACGYVHLPKTHPDLGKSDDELQDVRCHGGITYADPSGKVGFDHNHGPDDSQTWEGLQDECRALALEFQKREESTQ